MTHFYFLNAASKTRISCIGFFVFTLITSCQYTLLAYSYIAFCFQQLRPKISFLAGFLCLICLGIKVTIALLFIIIKIIFIFQNFIAIALTCCKIVYFCSRAQPSFRLRLWSRSTSHESVPSHNKQPSPLSPVVCQHPLTLWPASLIAPPRWMLTGWRLRPRRLRRNSRNSTPTWKTTRATRSRRASGIFDKQSCKVQFNCIFQFIRDLNYSDLLLTVRIFSLCKDKRTDFM